jgi:type II secretory pathway pseudopilin PulG
MSLLEVLLAAALLAIVGVASFQLVSQAGRGAALASEHQMAVGLAARVVDRLLLTHYPDLEPLAGKSADLDVSTFDGGPASTSKALALDGVAYRARWRLDAVSQGLLKLTVTIAWVRQSAGGEGQSPVVRLIGERDGQSFGKAWKR